MWPDFDHDPTVVPRRFLAEMEEAFGRPLREGEASTLARLIRKFGRQEIAWRLQSYRRGLIDGYAKPVTATVWLRRHGAFFEVQLVE